MPSVTILEFEERILEFVSQQFLSGVGHVERTGVEGVLKSQFVQILTII